MECPNCNDYVDGQGVCHTCQTQTVKPQIQPKYFSFCIDRVWSKVKFTLIGNGKAIRTMMFDDLDKAIVFVKNHNGTVRDWNSDSIIGTFVASEFLAADTEK